MPDNNAAIQMPNNGQNISSTVPETAAPKIVFANLGPAELETLEESHGFIMPIIAEVRQRFGTLPAPAELQAWVETKLKLPGTVIPSSLKILKTEELRDGIIDEIQAQYANKEIFESLKAQILEGFNEIVDNTEYGETEELVFSLDGFSQAIDALIEQNEDRLTDVQKFEISLYKKDLAKVAKLAIINEPDAYDVLLAMGELRHKLGSK